MTVVRYMTMASFERRDFCHNTSPTTRTFGLRPTLPRDDGTVTILSNTITAPIAQTTTMAITAVIVFL